MRTSRSNQPGFALAVAIFAIVVIGALVAGIFYASAQQYRIGRNQVLQTRATAIAEYGLDRAMVPEAQTNGWWKTQQWGAMAVGQVDSSLSYTAPNGSVTRVKVTRVGDANNSIYLIASEGRAGNLVTAQARRRMGMLVAVSPFQLNMLGALTTRGSIKIGGSSFIDGTDTSSHAGWNCPPSANPQMPGIATADSLGISTSGCGSLSCVAGSPKIKQDPAAGDTANYFNYGNGINWASLTAMANKTGYSGTINGIGPVVAGGTCVTSNASNWGDPNRAATPGPCEGYFPIIYAPGDLKITGGRGQGLLLVNGNLSVQGGFEFYGPVIVRRDLDTQGTGGHFNGGVMAANVNLEQSTVLGNAVVTFSRCILTKVLNAVTPPSPMVARAWTELY